MSRWKRVGLSFASTVAVELLLAVVLSLTEGPHLFFERVFGFLYFASILVVPGWLAALPIIVIPEHSEHPWRWKSLVIGTLIGPCIMFAIGIYAAITNGAGFNYKREAWYLVGIALLISFLTTAAYLTSLRLLSHSIQNPKSRAAGLYS
jgi:hypothetical protein